MLLGAENAAGNAANNSNSSRSARLNISQVCWSTASRLAWRRRQALPMLFLPALVVLVMTVYSVHALVPKMEHFKSPRPFCEKVREQLDRGGQWAMYRFYRAAYVYYTDSFAKELEDEQALKDYLAQPTLSLVVMKEKEYNRLKDDLAGKAFVVIRDQIGHRPMILIANQEI